MTNKVKRIIYVVLIATLVLTSFSCKKRTKHKWREVGVDTTNEKITPGVHPERGSDSNAVPVYLAPLFFPVGRNQDGVSEYKKYFYEMDELTADNIDKALKEVGIIDDSSVFCDLVIKESKEVAAAGPGASESKLTKSGTVRYVDLASPIDNSDDYEGKTAAKDLVGMIDQADIEYCITATFQENFQLVSCDIEPVDYSVYKQVRGIK